MGTIDTISELLTLSQSQYRVFDIGRRIDKISKSDFEKIENNQLPYPYPLQGHCHLALAFWQKNNKAPYLWFVKLPLDERGLLNQGARNHFIAIIVEALGKDLTVDPNEQQEELLKSNPYHFTPAQYKLASLNAKLTVELKHKASNFYEPTQLYFSGQLGWHEWQNIGVQGLADFSARINNPDNQQALLNALPNLPSQVFNVLSSALENEVFDHKIIERLISKFKQSTDSIEQQNTLRALAGNASHSLVKTFVENLLAQSEVDIDLLIIVSGRLWQSLDSPALTMRYLTLIAQTNNDDLFAAIFKDMVSIPLLRPHVLGCLRSPERPEKLAEAIGGLFNTNKTQ